MAPGNNEVCCDARSRWLKGNEMKGDDAEQVKELSGQGPDGGALLWG